VERGGRWVPALVFVSALASVPPYYLTSIACGALRSGIVPFAIAGFAGRTLRACALIWLPRFVLESVR
jgi:membrane protein YqaA with SNARE-associated domain